MNSLRQNGFKKVTISFTHYIGIFHSLKFSISLSNLQSTDVELESGVDSDTENIEFEKIGIGSDSRHKIFEQAESVVVQVIVSIDRAQQLCNTPMERESNPQTSILYQVTFRSFTWSLPNLRFKSKK